MTPQEADAFLDGRVLIHQSAAGFRAGLDSVLLAAAVAARSGQSVLELGAGVGTVSLCLAARVAGLRIDGVEIDPALVALAVANAAANGCAENARFIAADVFDLPPALRTGFDQVFCNPPFYSSDGMVSPEPGRALARHDGGRLADWLAAGVKRTRSGGSFTTIFPAERLNEALAGLPGGGVTVFPLWPKRDCPAKRVIVQVRIGAKSPLKLQPGLVLHGVDGHFTPAVEAILRGRGGLTLVPEGLGH